MSSDSGRMFFEEFIDDYFAECEEHLSSARRLMLELETTTPEAPKEELLDDLLRDFHSMKGLSAMVGMEEVTQISHHVEEYLRRLKQPTAEITSDGISHVIAAIEAIERLLKARRNAEPFPDITTILLSLAHAADETHPKRTPKLTPRPSGDTATGRRKWRFEFKPSAELASQGVTVNTVKERLESVGQILSAAPRILDDGAVAFEFVVATDGPHSGMRELRSAGLTYTSISETEPTAHEAAESAEGIGSPAVNSAASNLVRVEMSRLDDLMRVVGELVISRFHLNETLLSADQCLTVNGLRTLQEINMLMERQVRELRQTVIRTRMVPIGQIFERMRFVVRGLERETQKKIHVLISGQDTELDKVIVERMMDPLLHLVRNAISHGVETPEQRIGVGKPPEGKIRLSATAAGDSVLIRIEDDGRGIDVQKVEQRAHALGILTPGEILDPKRLLDVICSPGFTTREAADLASGRGVGMAAALASVRELGGEISLHTSTGEGTQFAIQLPLTLAIADSLLVTVQLQRFAIPQANIQEVFAAEAASVTVFENNEVLPYRGGALPIIRLANVLGIETTPRKRLHVLVIGTESSATGLVVDRVNGQREVVVRAITDPMLRIPGISGATELGDGHPVLILDVNTLLRAQRGRVAAGTRP
jgi:two-component system chemotaxis sensor kinase CheA